MRTINLFLLNSSELTIEKEQFGTLIEHINLVLRPRNVVLELVYDVSEEDLSSAIAECELCLAMFWYSKDNYAQNSIDQAYEEFRKGNNPHNIYVYFKESIPRGIKDELLAFKDSFTTKYGHFYCRFECVDTLKLDFFFQLLKYLEDPNIKLYDIRDNDIYVGEQKVISLENIPFIHNNIDYLNRYKMLKTLFKKVSDARDAIQKEPSDKNLSYYTTLIAEYNELQKDFRKTQEDIFELAKFLSEQSKIECDELYIKARSLFLEGKIHKCNELLDIRKLQKSTEKVKKEKEILEQRYYNLVQTWILKAKASLSDFHNNIKDRVYEAKHAYEEAINLAKDCNLYSSTKIADLYSEYACFLRDRGMIKEAEDAFVIASKIYYNNKDISFLRVSIELGILYTQLGDFSKAESYLLFARDAFNSADSDKIEVYKAGIEDSLGTVYDMCGQYDKAFSFYTKAFSRITQYNDNNQSDDSLDTTATIACNLGILFKNLGRYQESARCLTLSYSSIKELSRQSPSEYSSKLATIADNLASIYDDSGLPDIAEKYYTEALNLRKTNAEDDPELHEEDLAITAYNMGVMYTKMKQHSRSLDMYQISYIIRKRLASKWPEKYTQLYVSVAGNLTYALFKLHRIKEAKEKCEELLAKYKELSVKEPYQYLSQIEKTQNMLNILSSGKNYVITDHLLLSRAILTHDAFLYNADGKLVAYYQDKTIHVVENQLDGAIKSMIYIWLRHYAVKDHNSFDIIIEALNTCDISLMSSAKSYPLNKIVQEIEHTFPRFCQTLFSGNNYNTPQNKDLLLVFWADLTSINLFMERIVQTKRDVFVEMSSGAKMKTTTAIPIETIKNIEDAISLFFHDVYTNNLAQ